MHESLIPCNAVASHSIRAASMTNTMNAMSDSRAVFARYTAQKEYRIGCVRQGECGTEVIEAGCTHGSGGSGWSSESAHFYPVPLERKRTVVVPKIS
jgi:hypothetical protein